MKRLAPNGNVSPLDAPRFCSWHQPSRRKILLLENAKIAVLAGKAVAVFPKKYAKIAVISESPSSLAALADIE